MTDCSWRCSHILPEATVGATGTSRTSPANARRVRNRRGKRTQRYQGTPLTVEFLDNESFPATLLDESSTGFAIDVVDDALFHPGKRVGIRRMGMRTAAVVKYVQPESETFRVGLKFGRR